MSATSQVAKAIEHVATDVTNQADLLGEIVKKCRNHVRGWRGNERQCKQY